MPDGGRRCAVPVPRSPCAATGVSELPFSEMSAHVEGLQ